MMRSVVFALSVVSIVVPFLYLQNTAIDTTIFYEPVYFTRLATDDDPRDTYPMHQLGAQDRNTLINITDFSYSICPSAERDCSQGLRRRRPLILALIHSAPTNYEKRAFLRSSWLLHRNQDFVGLFMLGEVSDPTIQDVLLEENRHFGDLVQGHFVDTYHNLTYKHVMALKYAAYECPGARYVLKVDDDVLVDIPYLYKVLHSMSLLGVRDLLLCSRKSWTTVPRSYRSKWRMAFRDYPSYSYPTYCSGGAVLYSPDVVFRIYAILQRLPYFWVDDVHVTGTARVAAEIKQMYFLPNSNPFTLMHNN